MNELDVARHSRLVDPALHVWGWEVPVYLFLGGLAAGLMILASVLQAAPGERSRAARWLPFAAPILVSLGMGALLLDLEDKAHVWRFYAAFRWTSPMSWGAWILVLVYPVSLLAALGGLADGEAEALASRLGGAGRLVRRARAFAVTHAPRVRAANAAAGVGLGVYTGILLSTLGARALWGSALLGPIFLVSGLSTGAAFLLLFRLADGERRLLVRLDLAAIGAELVLLALFLVGLATGGAASRAAADLLLGGRFTAEFWTLVVVVGLAIPALLELLEHRLHLRFTLAAPALVLVGGLALRFVLVAAGQA
jgi:formate-dependent nitrite reductase membrane component NrfD